MGAEGIVMRVHRVRAEVVVAACDAELVGRSLPLGKQGSVAISAQFYGEREVSAEELLLALRRATISNLLGPRAVGIARAAGLVDAEGTGSLGGVPHAEIFTIPE